MSTLSATVVSVERYLLSYLFNRNSLYDVHRPRVIFSSTEILGEVIRTKELGGSLQHFMS